MTVGPQQRTEWNNGVAGPVAGPVASTASTASTADHMHRRSWSSLSVRGQKERLEEVIEAVNAVTARSHGGCLGGNSGGEEDPWVPEAVPTGWAAVDRWLAGGETPIHRGSARGPTAGGLVRGAVHEWFGLGRSSSPGSPGSTKVLFGAVSGRMAGTETSGGWAPPLGLLVHLAGQALRGALAEVPAPGMERARLEASGSGRGMRSGWGVGSGRIHAAWCPVIWTSCAARSSSILRMTQGGCGRSI